MFRHLVAPLFLCFIVSAAHAQCHCTYSLAPSITAVDNDTLGLQPGDTLCITASTKEYLTLINFEGNADSPLVVINCGGQVILEATTSVYYQQGINLQHCRFLQLTGTGDVHTPYGFNIRNTEVGSGLDARSGSTNLEIDHLEISGTDFAGMVIKDDPKCNGDYTRANFQMKDIHIHHNYIHHTTGEGLYVGVTAYDGFSKDCSGNGVVDTLLLGHEIIGVDIHHNTLDSIGREAIQVFSAPRNVTLHHNTVTHYALEKEAAHSSGIQLGDGSSGRIYSNSITRGYGSGIHVTADSTVLVYNNTIDKAGMYYDHQNATELATEAYGIHLWGDRIRNTGYYFGVFNNTIVCSKNHGIKQYSCGTSSTKTTLIHNNVILKPGLRGLVSSDLLAPMSFDCAQNVTETHNFFDSTALSAGFLNATNGDFRLRNTSYLINQGLDLSSYGIDNDFVDSLRPVNTVYDLGAYEHQAPGTTLDSFPGFNPHGCDFVLYPTGAIIDGGNYPYKKGNVFCLVSSDWLPVRITNFHGTKDSSITFRNYLGKVSITGDYGISLSETSYIEIKGDGDANHNYGFKIKTTTGDGIDIELSTGYNIHHVYVDSAGNNAIKNQDKPCDYSGAASRASFVQEDCQIHHNKFSYTLGSNTLLIGNPNNYYNAQGSCGFSYQNKSFSVFNNIFENNQGTAILLSGTDSNAQVFGNTFIAQEERCLYLDQGAFAQVYGNTFETLNGPAIRINEAGHQYIHNNVFKGMNQGLGHGIEFRPPNSNSTFVRKNRILNNTMVLDTASEGIYFYDQGCDTNNTLIANNIIVIPAASGTSPSPYLKLANTYGAKHQNNLFLDAVDSAYFTNAATGNYTLTSLSPAIDAGMDLSNDTFLIDFYLNARPDSLLEIGAFQYTFSASKKSAKRSIPQAPEPIINKTTNSSVTKGLYPNPATNALHISGLETGDQLLSIHDLSGKAFPLDATDASSLSVAHLAEGMYVLRILTTSQTIHCLPFMKK